MHDFVIYKCLYVTVTGSLTKSQKLARSWDIQEKDLRPEYHSISCELRSLAKMVRDEFREANPSVSSSLTCIGSGSMFERGRFYDEYSARRNERLKRKKSEEACVHKKTAYDLGVTVESSKRRDSKKVESVRKSAAAEFTAEKVKETPRSRYLLRSSSTKENNKRSSLSVVASSMKPTAASEHKVGVRRGRKI
ncbi:hypothetical protein SAY86_006422 [Trapa natans]|uniref:Uncharacterized protein n=1 Tax=Trapa natans TaxID=22666 RepID=A0AAN7QTA6_TRANT|nr:hypothetical protein SAY86_006422 [Trapa natans]